MPGPVLHDRSRRPRSTAPVNLAAVWLLLTPLASGAIGAIYLPLLAPALAGTSVWALALALALTVPLSLLLHGLGHCWVARRLGHPLPRPLTIDALGDAAQRWPLAARPGHEAVVALAGPLVHLALAGSAYLLWSALAHPVITPSLLFIALVNLVLGLINLAPADPLDGGRLVRAIGWWATGQPAVASRLACWLGWLGVAGLLIWSLWLGLQATRFGAETALGLLLITALQGLTLRRPTAWPQHTPPLGSPTPSHRGGRLIVAGALVLLLAAAPVSLLPLPHGLYAPGPVAATDSMITIARAAPSQSGGQFLLTTVITQTPIIVAQWVASLADPAVDLVSPEAVAGEEGSAQELIAYQYRLLTESIQTAAAVAETLAGYPPRLTSQGAEVVAILEISPARDQLQLGDRIRAVNGTPITLAAEVGPAIRAQPTAATVTVTIERAGQQQALTLPLLPASPGGDGPRLGISVQTVDLHIDLPVPVEVTPNKILGGSSAGLMLTLSIYDRLTPGDLTRGQTIAGTGTISLDGTVGAIGGVAQKVAAAERAGARYFLVPPANGAEARLVARQITIIEVPTAQAALVALQALPSHTSRAQPALTAPVGAQSQRAPAAVPHRSAWPPQLARPARLIRSPSVGRHWRVAATSGRWWRRQDLHAIGREERHDLGQIRGTRGQAAQAVEE